MRVLLVHNFYGSSAPSGENQVYEAERALLRARGHDVAEFTRHSDEIRGAGVFGIVKGALATPWNSIAAGALRRAVEDFRPDVLHAHNTFPLISPAVFHAAGARAARVLTLHNYRLFCAAGIPMRSGHTCMDCLDQRSPLPALRHGCYRDSRLATLPLALNIALHRRLGTWARQVDGFIALTAFQRERFVQAGLPADLVRVKPNFYPGSPSVLSWAARRPCVVFAGRLTWEKGLTSLIRAWLSWGPDAPELRIVGDGTLRSKLQRLAGEDPRVPIRFLGQLPSKAAQAEIAQARLLVLPSECIEGFPMVVREAFAFGTAAAVSDMGPLPSIVRQGENGIVFSPSDPAGLARVVRAAWDQDGVLERLGIGARRSFEASYTDEANYWLLMEIYEAAIATHKGRYGKT